MINPSRGIGLKIGSTLMFTLMLVGVKAVADTIPPGEIVFARSFFALVPIVVMLMWQGDFPRALRTDRPMTHLSRGTVGVIAMALSFAGLAYLPLPESMTICYASPLMIVVLAALLLGERVRAFRWTAVAVGFAGILVILWPRFTVLSQGLPADAALLGAGLALMAAFFSSFAAIFVRKMTETESTGTITFYFALFSSVLGLAVSLPFGWAAPDFRDAALLVGIGLSGGVGQIMMTSAYRHAGAATVASFEYVSMLWAVAFGYLFFRETPTDNVLLGGGIVIAAGMLIIYRERALGLERRRQSEATPPPPS